MSGNPYEKEVRNKEANYIIIDHEIHSQTPEQSSYNIPMTFFKDALSKGILKHDNDLNYLSKTREGEEFTLFACSIDKEKYSFKLGPGVLWLIGNEFNRPNENKFTLVYARKNGEEYSKDVDSDWRTKPQIRPTKYQEWGEGYEWFIQLFNKNISGNKYFFEIDEDEKSVTLDILFYSIDSSLSMEDIKSKEDNPDMYPHNWIFFGAPGTGKSHTLNCFKSYLIKNEKNYERVSFHPDYSYANFVGTYKPVSKKKIKEDIEENSISYEFVPGPFINVLVDSIKDDSFNPHLLIIEEINRSNVAAVFGDVFQLLDRKDGCSEYPIKASKDLQKYLRFVFKDEYEINFPNNEIKIPANMYIWATMNSADQGVFVMDSAFKRRWNFKFMNIDNKDNVIEDYEFCEQKVNWNSLRKAINYRLINLGINEDKLLGPFFIPLDYLSNDKQFIDIFKNKVLMYLFDDVAKHKKEHIFSNNVKTHDFFTFYEIYENFEVCGIEIFDKKIVDKYKELEDSRKNGKHDSGD